MRTLNQLYRIFFLIIAAIAFRSEVNAQNIKPVTGEINCKLVDQDGGPLYNIPVRVNGKEYWTDNSGALRITHTFKYGGERLNILLPDKFFNRRKFFSEVFWLDLNDLYATQHGHTRVLSMSRPPYDALSSNDIKHMPTRDMATVVSALGIPISGSAAGYRPENTVYYIDGIMVRGGGSFPRLQNNSFRK